MKRAVFFLMLSLLMPIMLLITWSSTASSLSTTSGFIAEYPIPTANSQPLNIVVESPGRVWFTMPGANAIGSLVVTSTVDYAFTSYPIPTVGGEPYDLVYDGTSIWFTERAGNKIGRLDLASKDITEFPILEPGSAPSGIAVSPDGNIWFTERDKNRIGRYNPVTTVLDEYNYPIASGLPEDIAVLNNNSIWFTAPGANRAVELTPSTSTFLNVPVQTFPGNPLAAPGDIVVDSSGPWVSAPSLDLIGRHAPGTVSFWRWYALPKPGSQPTGITYRNAGGQHQIWFVETAGGRVGQLVTDANGNQIYLREHHLPSTDSQPTSIAVDTNGHAWITESGSNMIAQWSPPYFYYFFLPSIPTP